MSKNLDETVGIQAEKQKEWIREVREERRRGTAEGRSSAPCLTHSSAASLPGSDEVRGPNVA